MDEELSGREQARLVWRAMREARLVVGDVWLHYFSIGGDADELEVEAYLNHAIGLPRLQRDMLAHAVNELILDEGLNFWAPYSDELSDSEGDVG